MKKKFFAPFATVAGVALVAVSLISSTAPASAAINGLSTNLTTVNPGGAITLTIDADNGSGNVTLVATSGGFTACTDAPADAVAGTADACAVVAGQAAFGATTTTTIVDDAVADNAGGNVDTLVVTWTATAGTTTPQSVTITVIQGTSTKTLSVNVRGTTDKVEVSALNAASASATVCTGTTSQVIRSTTATTGQANTTLCALVLDSGGNRLPTTAVVYTTTTGTLSASADTTGATGQRANTVTLAAGTTGVSGTTATVTASAGGKSTTTSVKFGGDPTGCTITTNPTTVTVGGAATVSVNVTDTANGPVPDGAVVNVVQVNSGQGANAAILNAAPTTTGGVANTTAIAAISGAIALGASTTVGTASCTGTLLASGTVTPPTGGGGTGTGGFTGTVAPSGVSLVVYGGGTVEQLAADASAAGVKTISVTVGGAFKVYVVGAPAFVNAGFPTTLAANTPVILAK